jgi:hypothetical protein
MSHFRSTAVLKILEPMQNIDHCFSKKYTNAEIQSEVGFWKIEVYDAGPVNQEAA